MTSRSQKIPKGAGFELIDSWFRKLKLYRGFPAKGTVSGALVVLEHLKTAYNVDIDHHTAQGGTQICGASGPAVKRILADFNETRPYVAEGGRTNRGLLGDIKNLLNALGSLPLGDMQLLQRKRLLSDCQEFLVNKVREFHNLQRIEFVFDQTLSTRQSVSEILASARITGKEGPVAQYIVGAKLKLRFPEKDIENKSYSTADSAHNRPGDFLVGHAAMHVTVAPMPAVFEKCQQNIRAGYRAYLLVPEKVLQGTRQNAELITTGPVEVESIESFVAQNILELSEFSNELLPKQFRRLLEIYNERVDAVEIDKSMMIEIPVNLKSV